MPVDEVLLEVRAQVVEVVFELRDEDVTVRGAATTDADGGAAEGGAETVRPMDGGAVGFGGGGLGLGSGFVPGREKVFFVDTGRGLRGGLGRIYTFDGDTVS